ncbi:MAG: arsenite methyltransferase [Verrucomicrobiae bacterium]|nr:arsenite methyltransferase [Verrucomicrobiae bacterium]
MNNLDKQNTLDKVREGYAAIATSGGSCCTASPACCGSPSPDILARGIGYSNEDLELLPDGANMGLSCGNPAAIASLRPGEIVLDLGCGGGFDVFIAARKVAPTGRAIGVDMTPEMISKARRDASLFTQRTGLDNFEFRLGEIEHLPVADSSVDVVISNCVINLSPDKPQVWREIFRVLKPCGRVAVTDLALLRPLPPAITEDVRVLVGCIAGAALVSEIEQMIREAGFEDVGLAIKPEYVEMLVKFQDTLYTQIAAKLPSGTKLADYVTSLEIRARKPAACCCGTG